MLQREEKQQRLTWPLASYHNEVYYLMRRSSALLQRYFVGLIREKIDLDTLVFLFEVST